MSKLLYFYIFSHLSFDHTPAAIWPGDQPLVRHLSHTREGRSSWLVYQEPSIPGRCDADPTPSNFAVAAAGSARLGWRGALLHEAGRALHNCSVKQPVQIQSRSRVIDISEGCLFASPCLHFTIPRALATFTLDKHAKMETVVLSLLRATRSTWQEVGHGFPGSLRRSEPTINVHRRLKPRSVVGM
ncbi:hypothetical protein VTK26DRAFT_4367 [Humicola hyalothermophila]